VVRRLHVGLVGVHVQPAAGARLPGLRGVAEQLRGGGYYAVVPV
jgi:hypothetical protein